MSEVKASSVTDSTVETETHPKPNSSKRLLGIQVLGLLSSVVSIGIALEASSERNEALMVYPSISRLLFDNDFSEVTNLQIDILEDKFVFNAVTVKPPEPEDVVAETIEVYCEGRYSLQNDILVIDGALDCGSDLEVQLQPDDNTINV